MSGIYGIFRYDGVPVADDWLACMKSAMKFYGPDGGGAKTEGSLAVGHLSLKIAPEDEFDVQPISGFRGLVVSAARLNNRDELLASLGLPAPMASTKADGDMVAMAFDRWGEQVANHLDGDWALAAWDHSSRTLMLARDACGNENLYYYSGAGYIAFASNIKGLLAIPGLTHEPNIVRLAEILVAWQHVPDSTEYMGIQRLPWAHTLQIKADGSIKVSRYWSPQGREPLNYRRDEDYEEEFLDRYTSAVRGCLRCNGRVAGMLSGGRDSGSVAAIAAPLLAAMGMDYTAYTSVPCLSPDGAEKTRIGHEWDQAHATALLAGSHIRHVAVDAVGYSVLGGIEHILDVHGGPSHAPNNHYWVQAICEAAARDKASVLLTGQMGNGTVSWTGNGSALLALAEGKPRLAWQLFAFGESSPWLTIKRQILKPALTPARRLLRRLRSPTHPVWQEYSSLNPGMASILDLDRRMREGQHDATFIPSPLRDQRLRFFSPALCIGMGILSELGARHAISIRDPTANLALVEFLLRVPDSQFCRNGQRSFLFQRAMRTKLPRAVLEGRRKGLQAADVGHRLLRERLAVLQCLDRLQAHSTARELLNIPAMRRCLDDLAIRVDAESTFNASVILLRGIGVGSFLLRFP